jgi:VWFA-related protein
MILTKMGVVVGLAIFATQATQSPDAPQPMPRGVDVIRLGVDLVRVDATVTDARGQHVRDLTAADFELLQDGRPQAISTFDYVRLSALERPPDAGLRPAHPGSTRPLAPHEVRRTIALIVDDLGLSLESTGRVRTVLQRFLDTQMQPGDLVAILRTGAGMGALQQFTSDRRALQAAADSVRWNMSGRISVFRTTELYPEDAFRNELFSAGTLGAVSYVIRGLSELPGRKSVILLSDGFSLKDSDGHYLRVLAALRGVVDASNRAGVVVYGIDMRGLAATGPTASEGRPSSASGRSAELRDKQEGLGVLAAETGGLLISNANDLSAGLARVLDDQQGYYLLGYVPDRTTFTGPHARFHTLSVRVKRTGLRVRSRSGFLSVPDDVARARRPENRMVAAVTSPFAGGDIRLRLSSFFGHHQKAGAFVTSVMHVDARDLTFATRADGMRTSEIEVLAMTFGENGQVADQTSRRYTFTLTAGAYERSLSSGLVYQVQVPLKVPGPYQLRIALRDVGGDRIGSASRFINVPDVKKRKLTLSGLLIEGVAPALREGVAPTLRSGGREDDAPDPQSTLAVRAFRQGSDASYVCSVYNARRGADGLPRLEAEARLYREGIEVSRSVVRRTMTVTADTEPLVGGVLHLTDTPPGDYVLELIVVDRLEKKVTRAAQTIDFTVIR